jgi:heme exporter protein A
MNLPTDSSTTLAHVTTSDAISPLLQASGLACRRGQEWLFRDLSFAVRPGQMLWLRGQNGSGKTTLLRVLAGLSQPDNGHLTWKQKPEQTGTERPVYVGHLNAMKDDLSVCESLQFIAGLHGRDDRRESALGALRLLGMHHRRHAMVRTLSQGQRRRAALARLALETQPSLWLLDEPFDALDTAGVAVVNRLLKDHLERGGGVLLTSHLALEASGPVATELTLDRGIAG